jgi:hypothetical protein
MSTAADRIARRIRPELEAAARSCAEQNLGEANAALDRALAILAPYKTLIRGRKSLAPGVTKAERKKERNERAAEIRALVRFSEYAGNARVRGGPAGFAECIADGCGVVFPWWPPAPSPQASTPDAPADLDVPGREFRCGRCGEEVIVERSRILSLSCRWCGVVCVPVAALRRPLSPGSARPQQRGVNRCRPSPRASSTPATTPRR